MPSEWTTKQQKAWLLDELASFKRLGGRRYAQQWPNLYNRWFRMWPEHPLVLPNVSLDATLTEEQTNTLATAITQRQSQLRRWLQWHAGAGTNRSANNKTAKIIKNMLKPKTRSRKPLEIYSKLYFKTRIQPHITSGMTIADITKKTQELYENESAEIKEEIRKIYLEEKKREKNRATKSDAGDIDSTGSEIENGEDDQDSRHR